MTRTSQGDRMLSRWTGSVRSHAETIELNQIRRSTFCAGIPNPLGARTRVYWPVISVALGMLSALQEGSGRLGLLQRPATGENCHSCTAAQSPPQGNLPAPLLVCRSSSVASSRVLHGLPTGKFRRAPDKSCSPTSRSSTSTSTTSAPNGGPSVLPCSS